MAKQTEIGVAGGYLVMGRQAEPIDKILPQGGNYPDILPPNCVWARKDASDRALFVLQYSPQLRTLNFRPHYGYDTGPRTRKTLFFPWTYLVLSVMKYQSSYNVIGTSLYFRNEPLDVMGKDVWFPAPLPHMRNTGHLCSARGGFWAINPNKAVNSAAADLFQSEFAMDWVRVQHNAVRLPFNIGDLDRWEQISKTDPQSILTANWNAPQATSHVIQEYLPALNNVTAQDIARLVINNGKRR